MAGRPFRFAITRANFKAALSALREFFRYWPDREPLQRLLRQPLLGDERTWLDCIENEVDDPIARCRLGVIWSKAAKERDRERSDANSAGLVGLEPRGCPAHARAQWRLDSKQPSRRMPL